MESSNVSVQGSSRSRFEQCRHRARMIPSYRKYHSKHQQEPIIPTISTINIGEYPLRAEFIRFVTPPEYTLSMWWGPQGGSLSHLTMFLHQNSSIKITSIHGHRCSRQQCNITFKWVFRSGRRWISSVSSSLPFIHVQKMYSRSHLHTVPIEMPYRHQQVCIDKFRDSNMSFE